MVNQMKLAQASLFIYVMLPGVSEYIIEEGYTKCVYTFEEMGGFGMYLVWMLTYFVSVEIGIYWVSALSLCWIVGLVIVIMMLLLLLCTFYFLSISCHLISWMCVFTSF
jgi:hypothetical protein